ncbi:hypothetical protein FTV88_0060 [Heliorestis convoluta]|uniref:Uncharacterized protein n=1 Tax=Heliorestis convoluta TaxID=356322 RepID=A0A5Q2MY35_9FIRM|nr:hypothetical protein FTV88_0060 [Heliorestis convoluta]
MPKIFKKVFSLFFFDDVLKKKKGLCFPCKLPFVASFIDVVSEKTYTYYL